MAIDQEDLKSRILFEDNHIIVVNKRPSEIVQGDKTGDQPLADALKTYIADKYNKPGNVFLGVVHRIDRPTSGLVIFARTSKGLARLNEMLKTRDIKKKYWAVVKNLPPSEEGRLEHFLKKNEKQNKSYEVDAKTPGAKKADLIYKVLSHSDNFSLLDVELLTGRHHQIRAQLAAIGCPIKGDLKYGFDRSNPDGSIHLHARALEFVHPVGKEIIKLIAPVPQDALWQFFENEAKG
jgi:23S rRNA pseudouridine1911/1915/1917 synthase